MLCAKNLTSGSLSKFAVAFFFATALSIATCKISAKKLFLNPGIVYVLYIYIYENLFMFIFPTMYSCCVPVRSVDDGQFQPPFAASQLLS